ncbi:MAG: hypothetical protein PHT79_04700 [Syntrophomonadaceae bacterium]|nr:hypothetical protein [Syntrophomonadaceae bacterium]MDD3889639.1 hypothetical protein [Syntrophomonadaceae bacterium]MDD4549041.1 hypothetical protein [Syntrophomonadaceae bacterium]
MQGKKFIILFICIFVLCCGAGIGCSKKKSPPQKPQQSAGQKPEAPKDFSKLRTNLDMIVGELEKKIKMEETSSLQQNVQIMQQGQEEQSQGQGQSQGQDQGQKQGQSQGQGQSGQQQSQGGKTSSQEGEWQKEASSLKKVHLNWNMVEPEAVKAGLSSTVRDDFGQSLDNLTMAIGNQDLEKSIFAAIDLYRPYADVSEVFKVKTPPEFFRLKYEMMSAIAEAKKGQWNATTQRIPNITKHWDSVKISLAAKQKPIADRTEYSVKDLEHALDMRDIHLVMVKGELGMKNLDNLESNF